MIFVDTTAFWSFRKNVPSCAAMNRFRICYTAIAKFYFSLVVYLTFSYLQFSIVIFWFRAGPLTDEVHGKKVLYTSFSISSTILVLLKIAKEI
jgi:hypothetical protein